MPCKICLKIKVTGSGARRERRKEGREERKRQRDFPHGYKGPSPWFFFHCVPRAVVSRELNSRQPGV